MYMFSLWIVVLKTAHKQTENENDDLVLVRSGNIKDQAPGSLRAAERQRADRARVHHAPATANGKSAKAPSALWVGLKRVRLRRYRASAGRLFHDRHNTVRRLVAARDRAPRKRFYQNGQAVSDAPSWKGMNRFPGPLETMSQGTGSLSQIGPPNQDPDGPLRRGYLGGVEVKVLPS